MVRRPRLSPHLCCAAARGSDHRACAEAHSTADAARTTAAPPQQSPRASAQSQTSLRAEFRTALEPHGRWQHHARFGDVWVPANRARDWRPYTAGRWVLRRAGEYHYGRWALDDQFGWCWVPGEEWSPAWVQWRRPGADVEYVGWVPLPPDEIIVEYVDEPRVWIFVRGRDFVAPRLT
jgi:hypothetical protein